VSTFTGAVDVEVGTLADQIALVSAGMEAAQVTPSGQGIKQVFTPHLYQRLPHSLSYLLKELPVVDGTFLAAFAKLRKATVSVVIFFRPSVYLHATSRLPLDGFS
jgi:hypothetical protein